MEKVSTFAKRLQDALDLRHMRPAELSRRTGLGKGLLSQYLHGETEPKYERLQLIANALDVSMPWLRGFDVAREIQAEDSEKMKRVIKRMETDPDFQNTVEMLASLPEPLYRNFTAILQYIKK